MTADFNVSFSNHRTGTNVTITRRIVDYNADWLDDINVRRAAAGTLTFPDIATSAALDPQMVRDDIEALMIKWGRIILGADQG